MEYVYAALLLDEAGKEINEKSVMDVVKAAGFEPDEARAKAIVESLKGVDIKDVIKNAQTVQASAPAASAPEGAKQEKKEEAASSEDQAKSEEEAAGGLASLFG